MPCDKQPPDAAGSAGAPHGGGTAVALWVTLTLLVVLAAFGAALLFVYRQELVARYFTPEGRAAASSGIDVVPLEESRAEEAVSEPPVSGQPPSGGVAPWLQ